MRHFILTVLLVLLIAASVVSSLSAWKAVFSLAGAALALILFRDVLMEIVEE